MTDPLAWVLLGVIGLALIAYVLTAGADFGAGVWDVLAWGPRADRRRHVTERAIAPIWEANHIWLIVIVVLLFGGFPIAFAAIGWALHVPLVLALVGMVLRGSGFVFHAYGLRSPHERDPWSDVFAWSSLLTPVCLGLALGGLVSGNIRMANGHVVTGFSAGWTTPFAFAVGMFTLVLFATLAAVYLTVEAHDDAEVREDFRRFAIAGELAGGVVSAVVLWRASIDAPDLFAALVHGRWSIAVQVATAALAAFTIIALAHRRFYLARFTVAAQVALVVLGLGLALDGAIVPPDVTLATAGARTVVMRPMLWTLALGALVLAPALWILYRVFKGRR